MEISGKKLQEELLPNLVKRIKTLKKSGVVPTIAIVTLGPEETWEAYVGQKIKLAKKLDINYKLINLGSNDTDELLKDIQVLSNDNTINGLIVQRPFPMGIDIERIVQSVSKYKDIDGFRVDSKFDPPIWLSINHFLSHASQLLNQLNYNFWLSNQSILIIGKGETAGKPLIDEFKKIKIEPSIIDTTTKNVEELYKKADVIIFATGKRIQVPFELLKKSSILIGIGLHRENGKLSGDFDENEAKQRVLYYTPSPGGVGPLNLYYLFDNLVTAAEEKG